MGGYIDSVKTNLTAFALYLESNDVDIRFSIIEFRDVYSDGENSTVVHKFADDNEWTSDTSLVESTLANISVGGGEDVPETPTEAISHIFGGYANLFREGASCFAFLLTDAPSKDYTKRFDNGSEFWDINFTAQKLRESSVYTSVVSRSSLKAHYEPLYSQTGGIFIDMDSPNYYELMLTVADWVIEQARDTDSDGLPDVWETDGVDIDGDGSIDVDLRAMGADPNVPDIFVYYDWMYKAPDWEMFGVSVGEKNLKPDANTLGAVVSQFKNHGINLHLIEGRAIPYQDVFVLGEYRRNWNSMAVKYFPEQYWTVARYCVFVNEISDGYHANIDLMGIAEVAEGHPGQFFLVAYGLIKNNWVNLLATIEEGEQVYEDMHAAVTFMHELGHTLGLQHGGNDDVNYKPNYLSIMNYLYKNTGLAINDIFERVNYSEYELVSLDEQHINENLGLDPEGQTNRRVSGLRAKWKLSTSSFLGYERYELIKYTFFTPQASSPSPSRDNPGLARQPVDFNGDGKIEANTTADFYLENGDGAPTNSNTEIIPKSYNDWANLKFVGGAIGGLSVNTLGGIPMLISPDVPYPVVEELTLEEAREMNLLGNPDDCTISSVMPDFLFSSVSNQRIKVTITNLFNSPTTARLELTSQLFDNDFAASFDLAENESIDVLIPVKSEVKAGNYKVDCTLKCANNLNSVMTAEINVIENEPFVVKAGEYLEIDDSLFAGHTPVIDDASIASIADGKIYGVAAGTTFVILQDEAGENICSIPIYVTGDEPEPQPEPNPEPAPYITRSSGGGGGCDSGITALSFGIIFVAIFAKRNRKI